MTATIQQNTEPNAKLTFALATSSDAAELSALHSAVAERLTRDFGPGRWSSGQSVASVLNDLRKPRFSRILIARLGGDERLAGTLRLATQKPWAINAACFTAVKRPLYLTSMAVHPDFQRQGIGRLLLKQAEILARAWPADAIRLDAYDAPAGAGPFYAKNGYREVARTMYRQCPLIYFELVLSADL